jgi:hypothetical protein
MNIKVINENKNYWYYNRKGLVCKAVEETDEFYVVKVWLNKNHMSNASIYKSDCIISEEKAWSKNKTIELVGDYLGWSECWSGNNK